MKFRYKVLIANLIMLSLSLGIAGYLMIHKNFVLARNAQLQKNIMENNLVQASVEYELLQVINTSGYNLNEELQEIGHRVESNMQVTNSFFYIKYGDRYVFSSDNGENAISDSLYENIAMGGKNYVISHEGKEYYTYVTSCNTVDESNLYIVSKSSISDAYDMMNEQIGYFRIMLIVIIAAASAVMYFFSRYLTRPLEQLNTATDEISGGNYDIKAEVSSNDEVGILAGKFNDMAHAVAHHVDELNDMIHRRDQFVADFTHEIKTPMTTIIGYADTMRSMELSREDEIMALNYIFSEGRRLENLSGKLFELIYLRQNDIEKRQFHTDDMIKEVCQTVTPMLAAKGITLNTTSEDTILNGNMELLITSLVNIIDNARKASKENDSIELTGVKRNDKYSYEITIADHGIGMTREDAAKICDEFYMVDKSRSRKEGGAGIGMSLVALVLQKHNAVLSVESELGAGTTMHILFCQEEL